MPQISGITKDALGVPCSAVVDVHRFENGVLVERVVTDPVNGTYVVYTDDESLHVVTRHVASVVAGEPNWSNVTVAAELATDYSDARGNILLPTGAVAFDVATTDPFGGNDGVATFSGGRIDFVDADGQHPAGDFTIKFRFKPSTGGRMGLVAYGSDFYFGIDYNYNGTRNINMWASSNGSSWDILQSDGGGANSGIGALSLTLNAWNYIEVTLSGDTWRSLVNGTLDREVVAAGTMFRGTKGLRIGTWGSGEFPVAGSITDFVMVNGTAEHTASFTPPVARSLGAPKPGAPTSAAQVEYVIPGTPFIPEA